MILEITCSIVLYKNDPKILEAAITSVLNANIPIKLYLIDNSPTDILRDFISEERIEYIHNPSNPGFGAAHNIAIKLAIEQGSEYHLVLNPDVYFTGNTLELLLFFARGNKDIGNLMPKVLYPDDSLQYLCKLLPTPYDWIGRRFNPCKRMVEKRNQIFELRFSNYDKIMEVPYLSGCFMFLNLEAIKVTGLFDERIFMYGEEADLCRRLINAGYKTVFYPNSIIYHHFEKGSHKSIRLTWIAIKSSVYYFNKWGWIFDKQRRKINQIILKKLNYY